MAKYYKSKTIYEPIYGNYYRFHYTNDKQKIQRMFTEDMDDFDGTVIVNRIKVKGEKRRCCHIILKKQKEPIYETIDLITHEAEHASGYIMDMAGVTPEWINEPKAYLAGWIARELSKFILTK